MFVDWLAVVNRKWSYWEKKIQGKDKAWKEMIDAMF